MADGWAEMGGWVVERAGGWVKRCGLVELGRWVWWAWTWGLVDSGGGVHLQVVSPLRTAVGRSRTVQISGMQIQI